MPEIEVVIDFYPGKGALGGVYTGLSRARNSWGLVLACDMPFINPELLTLLISLRHNYDIVTPQVDGLPEPLHALYSKNCLAPLEKLLDQNELQVSKIFNMVNTRYVTEAEITPLDPHYLSLFNVNTSADLRRAEEISKTLERERVANSMPGR